MLPLLVVNPVLAMLGQISAIIICLFVFVFVILAVALNAGAALGLGWVREKAELIKLLRPSVKSVNDAGKAAERGIVPAESENAVVRAVAQVPLQAQNIDKKAVQVSDNVADKVIEFRARTQQAKAIVSTFFAPRRGALNGVPQEPVNPIEIKSPGYTMLMDEKGPEKISELAERNAEIARKEGTATQYRDAPAR